MDEIVLTVGRLCVPDDTALLTRAKRGDLNAFEDLLKQYENQVYRVALRLLGNPEDARDITQEVFLRFHTFLPDVDDTRQISPWLYRVTVNAAADVHRKRRRMQPVEPDCIQGGETPETHTSRLQLREMLEQALARLPEKERAAVVLRDVEGLTTAEVAVALGSSEATVRSQISTARAKLRQWLRSLR